MNSTIGHTAVHEAGHAVSASRLTPERYIDMVTIIQNLDEDYEGVHAPTEYWDHDDEAAAGNDVLYRCAGYAACIVAGMDEEQAQNGCDADFENAENIIKEFDLKPLAEYLRDCVEIMSLPENKKAVQRIAKELLEHKLLLSEEVEVLINVADGETSEQELAHYRSFAGTQKEREHRIQLFKVGKVA